MRETVLEQIDGSRRLWENAYSNGKGESDLASVARLAVAGRIRLLLTQHGRNVWGRFDRHTGEMEHIREGGEDPARYQPLADGSAPSASVSQTRAPVIGSTERW